MANKCPRDLVFPVCDRFLRSTVVDKTDDPLTDTQWQTTRIWLISLLDRSANQHRRLLCVIDHRYLQMKWFFFSSPLKLLLLAISWFRTTFFPNLFFLLLIFYVLFCIIRSTVWVYTCTHVDGLVRIKIQILAESVRKYR